jgi:energy-coupling factor transporter ATP-binding protein EcfA2
VAFDIRPLQRAQGALRFTTPLKEGDPSYVERPDGLGQQILDHIMVPSTHRLLLAGPAGCGKSTELLQLHRLAYPNYSVFVCPCDRDLDLYRFDPLVLARYLLWRMVLVTTTTELASGVTLSAEIQQEVLKRLGTENVRLDNPRMFFSGLQDRAHLLTDGAAVFATFSRLVAEIERAFLPALLLIDGLEKIPSTAPADALGAFIRSPALDGCQSVIVVPSWTLYGWDTMEQYPDTEVLRIPVASDAAFVRSVLTKRVGEVFEPAAMSSVVAYSGGVVRDGLQIASMACRHAMSERISSKVTLADVDHGRETLRQSFLTMISDDPNAVAAFLNTVKTNGTLPGNPPLRNRLLGNGIVLPNPDGTFRVHPCVAT